MINIIFREFFECIHNNRLKGKKNNKYLFSKVSNNKMMWTNRVSEAETSLFVIHLELRFLDALLTFWIPRRAKLPKHSTAID